MVEIRKRSQAERMTIALGLLESIWEEMCQGKREPILQNAVNAQVMVNRIVWRLNEDRNDKGTKGNE